MNKNSRGFAPLIIVMVLALIGLAGYIVFRSTTLDSTANLPRDEDLRGWKTFIEGKYSIKYPAHLQVTSDNNKDTILTDKGEKIIKISRESTTAKDIKEYAKGILFTKPTKINEYEAIEILNDVANAPFESYVLVNNGFAYWINNEAVLDSDPKNDVYFSQILSTFKFIDDDSQTTQPITGEGCVIGGCNGELCQDVDEEPLASICIYRSEYVCYKSAICERQADGNCSWTQTEELKSCLSKY